MADKSKIEWTDASWNPIRARNKATGKSGWHCEHVTTGCENCYAEPINKRLGSGLPFKPGHRRDIEIFLDQKMLTQPLRWKKPRKIFVGSMTDLFGSFVPDDMIDKMFAVMALCPQHTFQVLTKRSDRMRQYLSAARAHPVALEALAITLDAHSYDRVSMVGRGVIIRGDVAHLKLWPLPNVWVGVSAENQDTANQRIPDLVGTPAAVRFISAEPLFGPIDLERLSCFRAGAPINVLDSRMRLNNQPMHIDWIIVGGESGPKARPMHPDWARSLRDQCKAAGTAFFFKQWGEWVSVSEVEGEGKHHSFPDGATVRRIGKAAAGRKLDGVKHSAFPSREALP